MIYDIEIFVGRPGFWLKIFAIRDGKLSECGYSRLRKSNQCIDHDSNFYLSEENEDQ